MKADAWDDLLDSPHGHGGLARHLVQDRPTGSYVLARFRRSVVLRRAGGLMALTGAVLEVLDRRGQVVERFVVACRLL